MFRPRVIPVILIGPGGQAVKSIRFGKLIDLGDPVNTVSLFNAFAVDELAILDIRATRERRPFDPGLMRDLAEEARIPLTVGGGVRNLADIEALLHAGAEKVVISSAALADPAFVSGAADAFGSSSITVCLDARKDWRGRYRLVTRGSAMRAPAEPAAAARLIEEMGAGEIIIQSVDRDGTMSGYDLDLLALVADAVGVPVVALGGAGRFEHLAEAQRTTNVSALASGSLFCFQDEGRGVLISYPGLDRLAGLQEAR